MFRKGRREEGGARGETEGLAVSVRLTIRSWMNFIETLWTIEKEERVPDFTTERELETETEPPSRER